MKTESAFINSLLERGILVAEGALGSYQLSFPAKKEYFCDLDTETGQMFVNTTSGRIRYFPRDIIDNQREEFNTQNSGLCRLALMTFADTNGRDLTRHTFYAVIHDDDKIDEYNLGRNLPAWRKRLLKEDWQVGNPTRLTLMAAAEDVKFLASTPPEQTNAYLERSRRAFRHVAIVPINTSTAVHVSMDSEIDRHTGLRFHIYGSRANNCTGHAGDIFRRYGFEIRDIGLTIEGKPPHSLLLKNRIEDMQSRECEPELNIQLSSFGEVLTIPIYQRGAITYIDATHYYTQYLERRGREPGEKLRYNLSSFLELLKESGITLGYGEISYNGELQTGNSVCIKSRENKLDKTAAERNVFAK